MKSFTVRYAHLSELPIPMKGNVITRGDKIGRMGSTGQSKHNHLHIDVVESLIDRILRLSEIGYDKPYTPNIKQLNYFIDEELFGIKPVITTYFYDPEYKTIFGKEHPAYDVVPEDRHETDKNFSIYWNRSMPGVVLNTGFDRGGYGNYILIGYTV